MASLDARAAEADAAAVADAARKEKAALTLQQGEERAAVQVQQAVSGTTAGVGSNAEVLASQRLMQRIDALTMDSNKVRAMNEVRRRQVNSRNEAALSRVSAQNLRATAGSISPGLAAVSSLLGSSGTLANQWVYSQGGSSRRR
jgi:hypothetical protein